MNRYCIPAIMLAAAPLTLAHAEPAPAPQNLPPASCPQAQQHAHQGTMQPHMGDGAMNGSGHMMQHGTEAMGSGTMGPGTMQGQAMPHGGPAGMGAGNHPAMQQGQAHCPVANQTQNSPAGKDK